MLMTHSVAAVVNMQGQIADPGSVFSYGNGMCQSYFQVTLPDMSPLLAQYIC